MTTRQKQIGRHLIAARKSAGLSQSEVALSLGLTRQAVSSWELGRTMPTAVQIGDLAILYGTVADMLIFGVRADAILKELSR